MAQIEARPEPTAATPSALRAAPLISTILLTEASIACLMFAIAQQYPVARLHVGQEYAGFAVSAYGLAKLPSQPVVGWLADHYGAKLVLLLGVLISLPPIVAMATVRHAWTFVILSGLFGVTVAVVWPCVYAIIGGRFRPWQQGRLLGTVQLATVLGNGAGIVVGAWLIDHVSFDAAFGAAFLLKALALASVVIEPDDVRGARLEGGFRQRLGELRGAFNPAVRMLVAVIVMLSVGVSLLLPALKPYSEHLHFAKFSSFVFFLIPPAAIAVAILVPAGYMADRLGRIIPVLAGVTFSPFLLWGLSATDDRWIASGLAILVVAGYGMVLPASSALVMDQTRDETRGLLVGAVTAMQAVGLAIGPALGGQITVEWGATAAFKASAVLVAVGVVMTYAFVLRYRHALPVPGRRPRSRTPESRPPA